MRGRTARRKDMVRSGAIVTEGHRRVRPDEHAAGIANPLSYSTGVSRDDFEVLRRITIDDLQALLEVAHENRGRLFAAQRGPDPLDVLRELDLTDELDVYRLSQGDRVGDEHRGRQHIVLSLADEIRSDVHRVGRPSANTAISVGPASASTATTPRTSRFAAAT